MPTSGSTTVNALATLNGDLYAGGSFSGTGVEPIPGSIARWDGSGWHTVGTGVSGSSATVNALHVFAGKLIVGGVFNLAGGLSVGNIAQWDGANWSKVGTYGVTTGSAVESISVFNGALFVGGEFSQVDAVGPMGNVATWNGASWGQVAGAAAPLASGVRATAVINGKLHLTTGSSVNVWDGTAWSSFGVPMSTIGTALTGFGGEVILGGSGGTHSIARRDSSTWRTLGNGMLRGAPNVTDPRPVVAFNGGVAFSDSGFSPTNTGVMASGVAFWDGGSNLTQLGGPEWSGVARPRAMIVFNNQLIAAGQDNFAIGGCVSVLNGGVWQGLGTGTWSGGRVSSLALFNGDLIAGGNFTSAGGTAANRVARWTGSNWQPFGSGLSGGGAEIRDLAVYKGQLYATGAFSSNGNFARWNGSAWQTVSIGINQMGFALAVYNSKLYVGGTFTLAGGNAAHGVAYWDGTTLTPDLGGSLSTYSLLSAFGNLYAGGFFHFAGPGIADNIAKFDGTSWGPMGSGIGAVVGIFENFPAVRGLAAYGTQVIAAGDFLTAGNTVSTSWARYGCPAVTPCHANCDGSTTQPVLNANDFNCFLNQFAAANPLANCDGSTTPPVLNANDFICFLNAFAAGCS